MFWIIIVKCNLSNAPSVQELLFGQSIFKKAGTYKIKFRSKKFFLPAAVSNTVITYPIPTQIPKYMTSSIPKWRYTIEKSFQRNEKIS